LGGWHTLEPWKAHAAENVAGPALGLGSLVVLMAVSMLASARTTRDIYVQPDELNSHHRRVDESLRRLRSDVNLSGIFVRDYLLDVARERAPEYRQQINVFRWAGRMLIDAAGMRKRRRPPDRLVTRDGRPEQDARPGALQGSVH